MHAGSAAAAAAPKRTQAMETERTDTEDPQSADQQHLTKKVVNGDATVILDKTHARLNGECVDTKNSEGGSPLVNGSDDIVATARNGGDKDSESDSDGQGQTNGKTDSDSKDHLDGKVHVGEPKDCVALVTVSSGECILLDDDKSVNGDSVTTDDADKTKVTSFDVGDESVQTVIATDVNSGSTNMDNGRVSDTSNKNPDIDHIDRTHVTELIDDDSCSVTNLDESSTSRDVTNLDDGDDDESSKDITSLDDGDSGKGVTNLDDGDSSKDVTNLDDGDSSKDVTNLDDGDSSKDVTNLDDGDSSKDVSNLDDGDSSKDVTNLDDGDTSKDLTNLDDGDSSKDVTNLDDGDSSKDVTNLDDGDSSKDVSNLDDGDSSKDVTNLDDGDTSKDLTNLDDGDSSKDVTNLHKDGSSRKFAKLDKGSGESKGSRKFKKLDKGDVGSNSRADSNCDDDNSRDVAKSSEPSRAKSSGSCDVVNLDDDDDSNITDVTKTVAASDTKEEAAVRTHAAKTSSVVTNKMTTNISEARKILQKPTVTTSSGVIKVKDVTPIRSAASATSLPLNPSHSSQGPQSLAAKGHPASVQLRPMSNLLYDLGLNLTKEQVYKDLIRIQTRKRTKNRLTEKEIQQLNKLKDAHKNLSKKNTCFHFQAMSCRRCAFKTDSLNALAYHDEFVETDEAGNTLCGLCDFKLHSKGQNDASKGILDHIRHKHKRQPRIYTEMLPFTCAMCLFETNLKLVLAKHMRKCERNFKLARNLEPGPADCDIPMKLPRYGAPTLSETLSRRPQAAHTSGTVGEHLRKRRENVTVHPPFQQGAYRAVSQSRPARPSVSATSMQSLLGSTTAPLGSVPQQLVQVGGRLYNLITQNGQTLLTPITAAQLPVLSTLPRHMSATPQPRIPGVLSATTPALGMPSRSSSAHTLIGSTSVTGKTPFSPEPVITVVDKNSAVAPAKTRSSPSTRVVPDFEICEICGGFVKDRDSLRIHFYYAHKVEIQRDVFLKKKGQLLCDLCAKHFWTYQGLVKHRQVEHKHMKEDDYRCYLCAKSGVTDMLGHLYRNHGITRETLFRRTVCPCCGQHFATSKSLESHMRLAHAAMFRQQDSQPSTLASHLKESTAPSEKSGTVPTCLKCNLLFETTTAFLKHCEQLHTYQCSRCTQKWSSLDFLQKHFRNVHGNDKETCQLCSESVYVGRPYIHHMKRKHLKAVSVSITRLPDEKCNFHAAKRRKLSKDL